MRRYQLQDPLDKAAGRDSRITAPQPATPATRDDFAALRRRARQAEHSATLNF